MTTKDNATAELRAAEQSIETPSAVFKTAPQEHTPFQGAGLGLVLLRIPVRRPYRDANNLLRPVPVVALRSTTG